MAWLQQVWKDYGPIVLDILSGVGAAFVFVGRIVDGLITKISDLITKIKEIPSRGVGAIARDAFAMTPGVNLFLKKVPQNVVSGSQYGTRASDFGTRGIGGALAAASASFIRSGAPAFAGAGGPSSASTNGFSLNAPISINGAGGDPKDIAKQIRAALDDFMKTQSRLERER